MSRSRDFLGRHQTTFIAILLYGGLTVVMTWPLAAQLGTHIPGLVGDSFIHFWTFAFVKDALLSGNTPYFTDQLFYPEGTTLVFHNIAWLNILIWLLLQLVVDSVTAYTLMFMSVLAFNGFATFLLARDVIGSAKFAFISGMICAFWPYVISHQDHPNLIFVAWIALALLYLRRLFARSRWRDAVLAGLFVVLTGVTRWQLLLMATPLLALFVLYELARAPANRSSATIKRLLLVGGIVIIGLLPLMAPVVYAQFTRENPGDLFVDEPANNTDLLAFVVPSRYHPLWGQQGFDWSWPLAGNVNYVPFLGYTTLLLAIIGAVGAWRRSLFWTVAAGFYALMALGSELHLNGPGSIPLPFRLIEEQFLAQAIRHPERLNVILSIPMALLAGFGLWRLLQNRHLLRYENVLVGAVGLLLMGEYIVRFPTLEIRTPVFYELLAAEEDDFAILDIPMHMRRIYDKQYMIYQLSHGRPLVEGHVSRPPREAFQFIEANPLLAGSREMKNPPPDVVDVSTQLQLLNEAGIRYLILHKQFLNEEQEAAWRSWLLRPPDYEDDELVVYGTDTAVVGDAVLLDRLLLDDVTGGPFGLIAPAVTPAQTTQAGWVEINTGFGAAQAPNQSLDICFELNTTEERPIPLGCQPVSSAFTTDRWSDNELVRATYTFQADPYWPTADYDISAQLQDEDGNAIGREAAIGALRLDALSRHFEAPESELSSDAVWEGEIALTGYDLTVNPDSVDAIFQWQALERPATSYKFFVHVINQATGELAAQIDYVPRDWNYPTNWWEAGEFVSDRVLVPLTDMADGEYQIVVGIYHPDTGERLALASGAGAAAGDVLPLQTFRRP